MHGDHYCKGTGTESCWHHHNNHGVPSDQCLAMLEEYLRDKGSAGKGHFTQSYGSMRASPSNSCRVIESDRSPCAQPGQAQSVYLGSSGARGPPQSCCQGADLVAEHRAPSGTEFDLGGINGIDRTPI